MGCIIHKDRVKKRLRWGRTRERNGERGRHVWKKEWETEEETFRRIWTKCKIRIRESITVHGSLRRNSKFVESKWTSVPCPGFTLNYPFCLCTAAAQLWQPLSPETPPSSAPSQNIREYQGILHPGINAPNHLARFRSRMHPSFSWTR